MVVGADFGEVFAEGNFLAAAVSELAIGEKVERSRLAASASALIEQSGGQVV